MEQIKLVVTYKSEIEERVKSISMTKLLQILDCQDSDARLKIDDFAKKLKEKQG